MMKKKILAILLSLIYIISALPAFAAEAEEAAGLEFFRAFSFAPDEKMPSDALTRYELTEIFYKIVTKEEEIYPCENSSPNFIDVDSQKATSVDFVCGMGVMNGVGDRRFNPEGSLTYVQLIKTMVSFLGYDEAAKSKGGYPNGYYAVGSNLGITMDAPGSMDTVVTWDIAQKVFLNAIDADVAMMLNGQLKVLEGTNYMKYYHGIKIASGVVTADGYSDTDGNKSQYYGIVKINSIEFDVLEGARKILENGGRYVTFMYKEDKRRPEIVYFEIDDIKEIKILSYDLKTVTNDAITYYEGTKEKSLKYNITTKVMYNGTPLNSYLPGDLNPFDTKDGYMLCIDNDQNGILDSVYINAYEVMIAGTIRDGVVYSKFPVAAGSLKKIDLEKMNEGTLLNAEGKTMNWKDIKEGDILCYERDKSNEVTKAYMVMDQGGGIVEEVVFENTYVKKVKISDMWYEFGKSTRLNTEISKVKPGVNVVLYFGIESTVVDFEIATVSGLKTGYVTAYKKGGGLDEKYTLRVFTEQSKFEAYDLAEKVRCAAISYKPIDLINTVLGVSDGKVKRQLIKYTLNDNNEINLISVVGGDDLVVLEGLDGTSSMLWRYELNTFGLKIYLGTTSSVFVVPTEAYRDVDSMYNVTDRSVFGNNGTFTIAAYNDDKLGRSKLAQHVVYIDDTAATGVNFNTSYPFIAIESIKSVIDEDGTDRVKIIGLGMIDGQNASYGEFYAEDVSVLNVGPGGTPVEAGDVIKVEKNVDGRIGRAQLVLDKSANKLHNGTSAMANPSAAYPAEASDLKVRYSYGKVVSKADGYCTVELINTDSSVTYESYVTSRMQRIYTIDRNGQITSVPYSEDLIFDSDTFGDDASNVFVFLRGPYFVGGIVFNE